MKIPAIKYSFVVIAVLLFIGNSKAQNLFTYLHSLDLTGNAERDVLCIDGKSIQETISIIIYDNKSLEDSVLQFSKQRAYITGRYGLINKPKEFLSALIYNDLIYFLSGDNEIILYERDEYNYRYSRTIKIIDEEFVYDQIMPDTNKFNLFLASSVPSYKLNNGFLRVIKITIPKNTDTVKPTSHIYEKTDSLNFLNIYQPTRLFDYDNCGHIGIISFEGDIKIIKNNKIYQAQFYNSPYTSEIKNTVLNIQNSYRINPTYEKLNEADDIVFKYQRLVRLDLCDSFLLICYHRYDSSNYNKNSIPISFVSTLYIYHLDEENLSIKLNKIGEHIDNINKLNSKEQTHSIVDYIDLSNAYIPNTRFVDDNYLYVYCEDILDFINNSPEPNNYQFYQYRKKEPKRLKLHVFSIK